MYFIVSLNDEFVKHVVMVYEPILRCVYRWDDKSPRNTCGDLQYSSTAVHVSLSVIVLNTVEWWTVYVLCACRWSILSIQHLLIRTYKSNWMTVVHVIKNSCWSHLLNSLSNSCCIFGTRALIKYLKNKNLFTGCQQLNACCCLKTDQSAVKSINPKSTAAKL